MKRYAALIFDVDGTLAETEEVHRLAFNEAFAHAGLPWHWDAPLYLSLLHMAGGKERIRLFASRGTVPLTDAAIADLHRDKTERYAALVAAGGCALRPGIEALLDIAAARGQRLAIATTTSRANVEALLAATLGPGGMARFEAIVAGDEVAAKKPAPDVYVEALARLGLPAAACLAIEDSRIGLAAATGAGLATLVTRSRYSPDREFPGALRVVDAIEDFDLSRPAAGT